MYCATENKLLNLSRQVKQIQEEIEFNKPRIISIHTATLSRFIDHIFVDRSRKLLIES